MQELERATLENLGSGAARELFDAELAKVIENCLDINTTTATREVRLVVKIKPNDDRTSAEIGIQAQSKLAPNEAYPSRLYIGTKNGQPVAFEDDPHQTPLPFESEKQDGANVVDFKNIKEARNND